MASSARIDELRKKFDENPRRYFAPLANEYRKAGDLEQAIFICEEYLPQQPGHMSGHIVYGQALFELGRHAEAKTVFETALSLDPENLIALRHLGDIARQAGDNDAARVWYQRVLEADPRNEEIAQLMLSLLSSEGSMPVAAQTATPAAGGITLGSAVSSTSPTPLATPAVEPPLEAPAALSASAASSGFEVEKSEDHTQLSGTAPTAATPPVAPPPPPATAAHQDAGHELLDIEDFSFSGSRPASPTTDAATSSGESDVSAPAGGGPEAEMASSGSEAGFNVGEEEGDFEADPFAIAATPATPVPAAPGPNAQMWTPGGNEVHSDESLGFEATAADVGNEEPPSPPVELATDLELGLPDDGSSQQPSAAGMLDGLQTFEAGLPPAGAGAVASDVTESAPIDGGHAGDEVPSSFGGALGEVVSDPFSLAGLSAPEPTPEPPAESASEPTPESTDEPAPEAFVTETMAELYLEQGHLGSALEIYHRLVEHRPDDEALRERLESTEARVHGTPAAPLTAHEAASHTFAGPTIREFLSGILRSGTGELAPDSLNGDDDARGALWPEEADANEAASSVDAASTFEEGDTHEIEPLEPFADDGDDPDSSVIGEEPAAHEEDSTRRSDARPTPTLASDTVSGSIDALFSGANAATKDAAVTNSLAKAFATEAPETAPLQGVPAHRAESELSLDHVFKTATPPRSASPGSNEGFSFDQFFADEAVDGETAEGTDTPSGSARTNDDIAQFNAWLNGLKKT